MEDANIVKIEKSRLVIVLPWSADQVQLRQLIGGRSENSLTALNHFGEPLGILTCGGTETVEKQCFAFLLPRVELIM